MQNNDNARRNEFKPALNIIDWPAVSDQKLIQIIVTQSGQAQRAGRAWIELLDRGEETINKRIRFLVGKCAPRYRASDTFDDIKSEVFVALLANDKARLRAFDSTRGSLRSWLSMIAQQTALTFLTRLVSHDPPESISAFVGDEDRDDDEYGVEGGSQRGQVGALWIAEGD